MSLRLSTLTHQKLRRVDLIGNRFHVSYGCRKPRFFFGDSRVPHKGENVWLPFTRSFARPKSFLLNMKINRSLTLLLLGSLAALLASCCSPAGTGAATGAAAGAVVGGPIGAAADAAGGAIIGAAVGRTEARRYPAPRGGYPAASPADRPGFVISPYTQRLY